MPLVSGKPPAQEQTFYDLLKPFGWAHIEMIYGGRFTIEMTIRCEVPLATVAEVRKYLTGRAVEALDALEEAGYQIFEATISVAGLPVIGKLRAEVNGPA